MFTLKANSKQKRVKKAKKRKSRSSDRGKRTVQGKTYGPCAPVPDRSFCFRHQNTLARKSLLVTPISVPFSLIRPLHLALSHSTETFMFLQCINILLKITYNHLSFQNHLY